MPTHTDWMREALNEAQLAANEGEVPVGAILVKGDEIISRAHNRRETTQSPLSHAEIDVIAEGAKVLGSWRLEDCLLFVTLEPCLMCTGAIIQARISQLIFGCRDPKAGAIRSLYQCAEDNRLNHQVEIVEGILAEECSAMLTSFFRELRQKKG